MLTGIVDTFDSLVGFVASIDKGQTNLSKSQIKLRQHRVAECFRGDTGTVGHKEHGSIKPGSSGRCVAVHENF